MFIVIGFERGEISVEVVMFGKKGVDGDDDVAAVVILCWGIKFV